MLSEKKEKKMLDGQWHCRLDYDDKGYDNSWFEENNYDIPVQLPGTLCDNAIGAPLNQTLALTPESVRSFKAKYDYVGACWYQRPINVPESWSNGRVILTLERVIITSEVWVDGERVGSDASLVSAHVYDLTDYIKVGQDQNLTIRIDNRDPYNLATYGHSYTNETQTIWNGLVGEISLSLRPNVYVSQLNIITDQGTHALRVTGMIKSHLHQPSHWALSFGASKDQAKGQDDLLEDILTDATYLVEVESGDTEFSYTLEVVGEALLWNEFTPVTYTMETVLTEEGGISLSAEKWHFGFRHMATRGHHIRLNEQRISLRGNLENCIHPMTGYPPCDVDYWVELLTTVKSYGMNHLRFHSNCPPEAAFIAADQVGIYFQVEGPVWLDEWFLAFGSEQSHHDFIPKEAERIIRSYGNHPSFCLFCNGNELRGDFGLMHDIIEKVREIRPDILYTLTANYDRIADSQDDVFISVEADGFGMRGNRFKEPMGVGLATTYDAAVESREMPLIAHEGGQHSVYPDVREIPDYNGNLVPLNLMAIKSDLENKGLSDRVGRYVEASGKFSSRLYKEEIESYLRTEGYAGFQLLGIQDFPGQCTATVGMLDAYWRNKGFASRPWFKEFCNDVVPLILSPKRVYSSNEPFEASVHLYQYSSVDLKSVVMDWNMSDENGKYVYSGMLEMKDVVRGTVHSIGQISLRDFADISEPVQLTMCLQVRNTSYRNSWHFWVFPEMKGNPVPEGVTIAHRWNDETKQCLENGGNVLLLPDKDAFHNRPVYEGDFYPVFWSPVFFNSNKACGLYCIDNLALNGFPGDAYADHQWYHLLTDSFNMDIDPLRDTFKPIVEVVPNYYCNHRLTNLFAANVGKGTLIVSTLPLEEKKSIPEVAWFRKSLLDYLEGNETANLERLTFDEVDALFCSDRSLDNDISRTNVESFID